MSLIVMHKTDVLLIQWICMPASKQGPDKTSISCVDLRVFISFCSDWCFVSNTWKIVIGVFLVFWAVCETNPVYGVYFICWSVDGWFITTVLLLDTYSECICKPLLPVIYGKNFQVYNQV